MAFRGRGRPKKKAAEHGGKLMIVLRNRHMIWVDVGPEDGPALRAKIQLAMNTRGEIPGNLVPGASLTERTLEVFDTAPYAEDTIRLEDIVHVKYVPPSVPAPTEPKAKPE